MGNGTELSLFCLTNSSSMKQVVAPESNSPVTVRHSPVSTVLTSICNSGISTLSLLLITHHPGVLVIAHLDNSCPAWFLRLRALCSEVAFFATIKTYLV